MNTPTELQHTSSRIPPQFYTAVALLILLYGANYKRNISRMGMTERTPLEHLEMVTEKVWLKRKGKIRKECQLINWKSFHSKGKYPNACGGYGDYGGGGDDDDDDDHAVTEWWHQKECDMLNIKWVFHLNHHDMLFA